MVLADGPLPDRALDALPARRAGTHPEPVRLVYACPVRGTGHPAGSAWPSPQAGEERSGREGSSDLLPVLSGGEREERLRQIERIPTEIEDDMIRGPAEEYDGLA
jgi:hypothetical protein